MKESEEKEEKQEQEPEPKRGLWQKIKDWLSGLFGGEPGGGPH